MFVCPRVITLLQGDISDVVRLHTVQLYQYLCAIYSLCGVSHILMRPYLGITHSHDSVIVGVLTHSHDNIRFDGLTILINTF